MLYVNLRAGLQSKPSLIPIQEDISKYLKSKDKDYYVSLYRYNDEHKKILEETHTLAGIQDTLTNQLYFDFDSKDDLDIARADALETAGRLIAKGIEEDAISCYFTGNKGFSLEVEISEYINPDKFKSIVFDVAGDLKTFDGVVNDPNRIVRVANTKHQTSGLYKIPLTPEEISTLSIAEIRLLAKNTRKVTRMIKVAKLPVEYDKIVKVKEKPLAELKKELTHDISSVDMSSRPKGIDEARFLLMNGFFVAGERNPSMLCLAATLRNAHFPMTVVKGMLTGAAEMQADRYGDEQFPEKEIDLIINQVYGPNWKGGQFTINDPQNWLAKYARKMGLTVQSERGPETLDAIHGTFKDYVMNKEKNTIYTSIEQLDTVMPISIGSNIGIVAAAGAGKTAIALKILKHNSKLGIVTVFASLDMVRNRLFEKVLYNVTGLSRDDLYAEFKKGNGEKLTALVKQEYGNVYFFDKSAATIQDIKDYVVDVEQKTGQKVKMVMLDYFERVNSDVSDDTASSKKIANQIQDMVNDLNIAMVTLVQPNKFSLGGGPDTEIKSYTAIKGSSFLYQSFRGIISLSRPFYTPATKDIDKYMIINVLKNDLGELDRIKLGWVGKTGEVYRLEDHELEEFDQLLKMKKDSKEESGGWS